MKRCLRDFPRISALYKRRPAVLPNRWHPLNSSRTNHSLAAATNTDRFGSSPAWLHPGHLQHLAARGSLASFSAKPPGHGDRDNANTANAIAVERVLQRLKETSVEDAAIEFRSHDRSTPEEFHSRLKGILEGLRDAPQTCEAFTKAIQEKAGTPLRPTREHYQLVLEAWRGFQPPSAKRAQALLDYMDETAMIPCDTDSCNLVLDAWTEKGNAERAQAFFDTMRPKRVVNVVSYSLLLKVWSRSRSAIATKRADELLFEMKSVSKLEPSPECYLRVIECWANSKRHGSEQRIEDLVSLLKEHGRNQHNGERNTKIVQKATWHLLQAYHNLGNAHRAEELLLEFVDDFDTDRSHAIAPSLDMYFSVLSTWSKSPSSRRAARAEKLLLAMENHPSLPKPDTACYTAVLNCIAGSRKQGSAERAENLLRRMDDGEEPVSNMVSLTCVLIAWARSDLPEAPTNAERLYREILDRGMKPDRFVYAGLITAWGRSHDANSIDKVEDYFRRIQTTPQNDKDNPSPPTVVEYTAVIQAYANHVSRNVNKSRESVQRVEELLEVMIENNLRPNTLTYAAVLKTIAAARRIPDRRERADRLLQKMHSDRMEITPYIENLFHRCSGKIATRRKTNRT